MSQIEKVHARQILDSRGNPTVEVELALRSGAAGRAAVPSGASTGEFEATELRDGGEGAYLGKGVTQAVGNVNGEIAEAVAGRDAIDQAGPRPRADRARRHAEQVAPRRQRDPRRVAGRRPRGRRARRACRCGATSAARRAHVLPVPMMNVLNGGAHADNKVDFQEFMVVPGRRADVLRVPAHGRRGLPRAQEARCTTAAWAPRSATRAASRRTSAPTRRRCRCSCAGIEAAGYRPGEDVAHRAGPRDERDPLRRRLRPRARGPQAVVRRAGRLLGRAGRQVPDRLDRGRHGRGGLGRLEGADRPHRRRASSSSATTCSSPTPSACSAASTRASPTRS